MARSDLLGAMLVADTLDSLVAADRADDIDQSIWWDEPLPLIEFIRSADHLSAKGALDLYPEQRADLEGFLSYDQEIPSYVDKRSQLDGDRYDLFPGTDPKRLFDPDHRPHYNQAFLIWGKGCLGENEQLTDHASGLTKTVKEWEKDGRPLLLSSWDGNRVVLRWTSPVYKKGRAMLYRITLADGRSFVATAKHRSLSEGGWLPVGSFQVGHTRLLTKPPYSSAQTAGLLPYNSACLGVQNQPSGSDDLEFYQDLRSSLKYASPSSRAPLSCVPLSGTCFLSVDALTFSQSHSLSSHQKSVCRDPSKAQDYLDRCFPSSRPGGEQLHGVLKIGPTFAPSLSDALLHSRLNLHKDGCLGVLSLVHNLTCQSSSRHSVNTYHEAGHGVAWELSPLSDACESSLQNGGNTFQPVHAESYLLDSQPRSPSTLPLECRKPLPIAEKQHATEFSLVVEVREVGEGDFYDLTVSGTHCYFDSQGVLHHNSGKDTVCAMLQCWIAHILLCLKNPQGYLGLPPGESIDIPVIGYSAAQAKSVYFEKFKARISAWPWLRRAIEYHTGIDGNTWLRAGGDYVHATDIELPHKIMCWSLNSSLGTSEGKNIIFWILDELAAFASPVKQNLAREIHDLVVSSARSRFLNRWYGVAISFPRHKQDHMMTIANAVSRGNITDTYVSLKPTWVVRPDRTRDDFEEDYKRSPEDADTKYGCNPPSAIDAYFRSPELLLLHCSGAPLSVLRSKLSLPDYVLEEIANRGISPISEVDGAGDPVLDDRGFPKLAAWFRGQKKPSGEPYDYYLHLDPGATNDSFGFAMGHSHDMPDGRVLPTIDLAFRWTGAKFENFGLIRRQQWFDDSPAMTEDIQAAEIDFRTVREFIFYLAIGLGFNIVQISFDSWNSIESRQELEKRGYQTSLRIVGKEDYDEFKELAYNRQLDYYAYPILIEECYKLQIVNGTKVEAPRTKEGESVKNDSHKDVSDAVAAVSRYLRFHKGATYELWEPEKDSANRNLEDRETEQKQKRSLDISQFSETQRSLFDEFLAEED